MSLLSWLKNLFKHKEEQQQPVSSYFRPSCLKAIEDKPCVPDIYVCRHKSKDAYKCFKKHGYIVRVVRGRVDNLKDDHIWIELEDNKGIVYWYDPTWYNYDPVKYGCHEMFLWTDRRVIHDNIHGIITSTGDNSPPDRK